MTPAEVRARVAEQVRDQRARAAGAAPSRLGASRLGALADSRLWRFARPASDIGGMLLALFLTLSWIDHNVPWRESWALVVFVPLAAALLTVRGAYARRLRPSVGDSLLPLLGAISFAVLGAALADVYIGGARIPPYVFVHVWTLATCLTGIGCVLLLVTERVARMRGVAGHKALIVGAGIVGLRVAHRLREQPEYGLFPIGFLDADPRAGDALSCDVPVLGSHEDLEWIAQLTEADHVVLAFSTQPDQQLVELVRDCERLGLEVLLVPRLFDSLNQRARYEPLGGLPLQRLRSVSPRGWQFTVKHVIDRVGAALLLVLAAPVLLLIAAAIKLTSRGPVLFRQQRVGRDGRAFDLLKFRSMRQPERPSVEPAERASTEGHWLPAVGRAPGGIEGSDRRTPVGRLLRRASLDELPQLINVLRGDMSLVGPRPERPEFVRFFVTDVNRYDDRHRVKSGITGWAQVHGLRGQTSLADRVEWDNFYIQHWSLSLDLKILAMTAVAMFRAAE